MATAVNGVSVFRLHKIILRLTGQSPTERHRILYYLYSIFINVAITIGYPLHLIGGLFTSDQKKDVFKNLAINFTVLACSIKTFAIWLQLDKVHKFYAIITQLDRRIVEPEDVKYYRSSVMPAARRVITICCYVGFVALLASESATIIGGILGDWQLMYPGYFPFDVHQSGLAYAAAHLYQFSGGILILQNLINDTLGAMALAMLGGHLQLLGRRVSRIGTDGNKSPQEHNAELVACIQDYKLLLNSREVIQHVISLVTFVQIVFTGINICVVIVYMMFYVKDAVFFAYYTIYLCAMMVEIFPCCYYGTYFELEFEQLTYSIFSCNWIDRDKRFKQDLRIFAEQTLRKRFVVAGTMFQINLDTFFATCKFAYSLFAVIMQMR